MSTRKPSGHTVKTTDGALIQISRTLAHPVDEVWAAFTDSSRLSTWYGSYTGEPSSGEVSLSFVESPDQKGRVRIDDCSDRERLAVTLLDAPGGDWVLSILLEETGKDTTLFFTHTLSDTAGAGDIGPGWEYYLDRLAAALDGQDPDDVVWEQFHPLLVSAYEVLGQ